MARSTQQKSAVRSLAALLALMLGLGGIIAGLVVWGEGSTTPTFIGPWISMNVSGSVIAIRHGRLSLFRIRQVRDKITSVRARLSPGTRPFAPRHFHCAAAGCASMAPSRASEMTARLRRMAGDFCIDKDGAV